MKYLNFVNESYKYNNLKKGDCIVITKDLNTSKTDFIKNFFTFKSNLKFKKGDVALIIYNEKLCYLGNRENDEYNISPELKNYTSLKLKTFIKNILNKNNADIIKYSKLDNYFKNNFESKIKMEKVISLLNMDFNLRYKIGNKILPIKHIEIKDSITFDLICIDEGEKKRFIIKKDDIKNEDILVNKKKLSGNPFSLSIKKPNLTLSTIM